jgi:hypothetical protein
MKKTPSPRVIAAMWISDQLSIRVNAGSLEPGSLSSMAQSRVNAAKAEKVKTFIDKLAGKFIERMEKIVSKFENPPGKATPEQ